jgi:prepilin-type N-terminal cleavage/methylation domain-containing protein
MQISRRNEYGFTLVEIMIVVAVIGLLAAMGIPHALHAYARAQRGACICQLRQIESAKQQWALDSGQGGGATPTEAEIAPFLTRSGSTANLVCPLDPGKGKKQKRSFDTSYRMNQVTNPPTCKIDPTHQLP